MIKVCKECRKAIGTAQPFKDSTQVECPCPFNPCTRKSGKKEELTTLRDLMQSRKGHVAEPGRRSALKMRSR